MAFVTYTEPLLAAVLLAGLTGILLLPRVPANRRALRFLIAATAGLFVVSWPPLDWIFAQIVESGYRQTGVPAGEAGAIVVLSSYVQPAVAGTPVALADEITLGRCRYAGWLYRNWKPLPVFVSGGSVGNTSIAAEMARLLEAEGVPAQQIVREEKSRSTWENAVFTSAMLRDRGLRSIALVTEAGSMLRAQLCFEREGMSVAPAPYGRRTLRFETVDDVLPGWKSVRRNERVLHECGGLLWYKLRGWI